MEGVTWLPPDPDGTMKFEDARGQLWIIKTDSLGQQWIVNSETGQCSQWTPRTPRVFHYGPGGEYLPDGEPRVTLQPPWTFWRRLRWVIRCARTGWRYTRPTKE